MLHKEICMSNQSVTPEVWATSFATDQDPVTLSKLEAEKIVLFFYPKDDTPGCTIEVQEFRDLKEDFEREGTLIFGISRDSVASHIKFSDKFDLNFPLIADVDEILSKEFDVLKEKKVFGKVGIGIERSTFILNTKGEILKEWRNLKAPGHAAEVLEAIKTL